MASTEPFVTYLELRESGPDGEAGAGLSHQSAGLVLLHVLELAAHGEPRGAATIVHDAGEHGGLFLGLARELASSGWAVALPDLRGHGRSEGVRGHSAGVREVVRDLGDVQDHLAYRQPSAPKVLVGQGLGALWALAYACERPEGVAAVALCAPLLEPRFEVPRPAGGLMGLLRKAGPTTPGRIGRGPEARARPPDPLVHDVITLRAAEAAAEAAARYVPRVGTLPMPTLLLLDAQDPLAPAGSAGGIAGAGLERRVIQGAGRDLLHGARADESARALVAWLERALPR